VGSLRALDTEWLGVGVHWSVALAPGQTAASEVQFVLKLAGTGCHAYNFPVSVPFPQRHGKCVACTPKDCSRTLQA
jgi:hypothetical protein